MQLISFGQGYECLMTPSTTFAQFQRRGQCHLHKQLAFCTSKTSHSCIQYDKKSNSSKFVGLCYSICGLLVMVLDSTSLHKSYLSLKHELPINVAFYRSGCRDYLFSCKIVMSGRTILNLNASNLIHYTFHLKLDIFELLFGIPFLLYSILFLIFSSAHTLF